MNKLCAFVLLVMGVANAQTITFEASVTTGLETVTPELTWSTDPNADSCVAGGDWSGNKGPSGNETLPTITSSATYNLTCEWSSNSVTLTWTTPTQNSDGSAYTDPRGFRIYYGQSQGGPYDNDELIFGPELTNYVLSPLTPGQWYFVIVARNQNGVESEFSTEASKIIGSIGLEESVGITINPKPNAPGNFRAE